ncbi:hypothetical protein [Roseateles flavus]|uniref:Tetratricopeptide repeat protein n=1 Tax=Roseateles flavus TaxID=3149041 RepID=A0ABV0GDC9_9BURK
MKPLAYLILAPTLATLPAWATPSVDELLRDGESMLAAGHFDRALASCRAGLDTLGTAYMRPGVDDDTDLKLMAADLQRRNGHVDRAAQLSCQMLRARIDLYRRPGPGASVAAPPAAAKAGR